MALVVAALTPTEERKKIKELKDELLYTDATWYVLSERWWRQWCDYVDYKQDDDGMVAGMKKMSALWDDVDGDSSSSDSQTASETLAAPSPQAPRPGPIDNSDLVGQHRIDLRPGLVEDVDYVLLPEECYSVLASWYGGGPQFPRKVVSVGSLVNAVERVELYPICLPIVFADVETGNTDASKVEYHLYSRLLKSSINTVLKEFKPTGVIQTNSMFEGRLRVRPWIFEKDPKSGERKLVKMRKDDFTRPLDSIEFGTGEYLCLERIQQNAEGDYFWPRADFEKPLLEFAIGDDVDAKDKDGKWFEGYVCDVTYKEDWDNLHEPATDDPSKEKSVDSIQVHFRGWNQQAREWYFVDLPTDIAKVARMGTNTDGAYIPMAQRTSTSISTTSYGPYSYGSSYGSSSSSSSWYSNQEGSTAINGAAGLRNLGNTCYMNSTIQCLSNTPYLTPFMLSGSHIPLINRDNPLGCNGRIAEEWGKLLKDMWSGKFSVVAPRGLKTAIGDHNATFAGYDQQDSQELLGALLDGLHEDLNQVRVKPATNKVESTGNEDDETVAQKAWEVHRARNQSVVIDLCQGQLKSKLVCPKCDRVSITFDPFMFFSVPLPTVNDRTLKLTLHFADVSRAAEEFTLTVPKIGGMMELKKALADASGIASGRFVFADIFQNKIYRILEDDTGLSDIRDSDITWAWEMTDLEEQSKLPAMQRAVPVTVNHAIMVKNPYFSGGAYQKEFEPKYIGSPVLALIPREGDKFSQCNAALLASLEALALPLVNGNPESKPFKVIIKNTNGYGCGRCPWSAYCSGCELVANDEPCKLDISCTFMICWNEQTSMISKSQTKSTISSSAASASDSAGPGSSITDMDIMDLALSSTSASSSSSSSSSSSAGAAKSTDSNRCPLGSCFDAFAVTETLGEQEAWYCSTCKEHVCATKKMDLWRCPDVLVIHLKRFGQAGFRREKMHTLVDFPLEGLDMSPWIGSAANKDDAVYDLYAISNHHGGLYGGHYTAYGKNLMNGQWYNFDDSSVSPVSDPQSMVSSDAYVLYYARRNPRAEVASSAPTPAVAIQTAPSVEHPTYKAPESSSSAGDDDDNYGGSSSYGYMSYSTSTYGFTSVSSYPGTSLSSSSNKKKSDDPWDDIDMVDSRSSGTAINTHSVSYSVSEPDDEFFTTSATTVPRKLNMEPGTSVADDDSDGMPELEPDTAPPAFDEVDNNQPWDAFDDDPVVGSSSASSGAISSLKIDEDYLKSV